MVASCEIQLKLGNRLSAPPPLPKKNVARTPMVRCSFHQASALEVNGPPNLNVLPTPLSVYVHQLCNLGWIGLKGYVQDCRCIF